MKKILSLSFVIIISYFTETRLMASFEKKGFIIGNPDKIMSVEQARRSEEFQETEEERDNESDDHSEVATEIDSLHDSDRVPYQGQSSSFALFQAKRNSTLPGDDQSILDLAELSSYLEELKVTQQSHSAMIKKEDVLTRIFHSSLLQKSEKSITEPQVGRDQMPKAYPKGPASRERASRNAALDLNFDQDSMDSYSPDQNPSSALPHQPSQLLRHESDEISRLNDEIETEAVARGVGYFESVCHPKTTDEMLIFYQRCAGRACLKWQQEKNAGKSLAVIEGYQKAFNCLEQAVQSKQEQIRCNNDDQLDLLVIESLYALGYSYFKGAQAQEKEDGFQEIIMCQKAREAFKRVHDIASTGRQYRAFVPTEEGNVINSIKIISAMKEVFIANALEQQRLGNEFLNKIPFAFDF